MAGETSAIGRIKLGSQGLEVSAQGLGCMGMSAFYGPPKPEPDMIALIHHAIRSGITFFDTSDFYGPFTNEILVGKVFPFVFSFSLASSVWGDLPSLWMHIKCSSRRLCEKG